MQRICTTCGSSSRYLVYEHGYGFLCSYCQHDYSRHFDLPAASDYVLAALRHMFSERPETRHKDPAILARFLYIHSYVPVQVHSRQVDAALVALMPTGEALKEAG